ncbi:DMT family transporter [Deinococcus oregonensis]|uniref:Spermidine export protein MdtJ n=1 Tax=Deinococcus oregonensis TaxID=1805970 RepID=A0ABV6B2W8_9DEIO
MRSWIALFTAITFEVTGTLSLKLFSMHTPGLELLITYAFLAASYVLLSKAFRQIPVAVAFAVWEAVGLVLITGLGVLLLGEHLTPTHGVALVGLLVGAVLLHRGTVEGSTGTSHSNLAAPLTGTVLGKEAV